MYRTFVRNWWRIDERTGQRVPEPNGQRTNQNTHTTEAEAREHCQEYADEHDPGPLSRKMEYEEC